MVEINTESPYPVSIVIITLNEETRLPRLLAQLEQQTFQDIQLIVSDSKSNDHTKEKAEEYRHIWHDFVFYQCGVTKWPGYGRNRWAEQARHEILLFLDADTQLPDEKFLERTVSYFIKHKYDIAGCYLQANTTNPFHILWSRITNLFFFIMHYTKNPLLAWCYILAKKNVHTQLGWFDETIYLGEDSEYAKQAKVHGYKFGCIPERFVFDMRRVAKKWIRHTTRTYLTWFINVLRHKKMLTTDKKKNVEYEFDIYTK